MTTMKYNSLLMNITWFKNIINSYTINEIIIMTIIIFIILLAINKIIYYVIIPKLLIHNHFKWLNFIHLVWKIISYTYYRICICPLILLAADQSLHNFIYFINNAVIINLIHIYFYNDYYSTNHIINFPNPALLTNNNEEEEVNSLMIPVNLQITEETQVIVGLPTPPTSPGWKKDMLFKDPLYANGELISLISFSDRLLYLLQDYKLVSYTTLNGDIYYFKNAIISSIINHKDCLVLDLISSPLYLNKVELLSLLHLSLHPYLDSRLSVWETGNIHLGLRIVYFYDEKYPGTFNMYVNDYKAMLQDEARNLNASNWKNLSLFLKRVLWNIINK